MAVEGLSTTTTPNTVRRRTLRPIESWMVGTFFEGFGVLVKRGFIDASIVDDLMSLHVIGYWQKYEPVLLGCGSR